MCTRTSSAHANCDAPRTHMRAITTGSSSARRVRRYRRRSTGWRQGRRQSSRSSDGALVKLAGLHDDWQRRAVMTEHGDILERIAIDNQYVRIGASADDAEPPLFHQDFGGDRSGGYKDIVSWENARPDAEFDALAVLVLG